MVSSIEYIKKLRKSGLRPTKQRIRICEVLFNANKTFHFTINDLVKMIEINTNQKISLATVYNTVNAFEKKGYLKEITINSNQTYFDTNISDHHHFFDEKEKKLIDLENEDVEQIKIKKTIPGKKIKSIEVIVKVDNDNQS
jgi:Fur family iron response transcriptional regulator